jgi:hypothetical protein
MCVAEMCQFDSVTAVPPQDVLAFRQDSEPQRLVYALRIRPSKAWMPRRLDPIIDDGREFV